MKVGKEAFGWRTVDEGWEMKKACNQVEECK
jgi:hypothetical protein